MKSARARARNHEIRLRWLRQCRQSDTVPVLFVLAEEGLEGGAERTILDQGLVRTPEAACPGARR
jgi:hypothetical protein